MRTALRAHVFEEMPLSSSSLITPVPWCIPSAVSNSGRDLDRALDAEQARVVERREAA